MTVYFRRKHIIYAHYFQCIWESVTSWHDQHENFTYKLIWLRNCSRSYELRLRRTKSLLNITLMQLKLDMKSLIILPCQ